MTPAQAATLAVLAAQLPAPSQRVTVGQTVALLWLPDTAPHRWEVLVTVGPDGWAATMIRGHAWTRKPGPDFDALVLAVMLELEQRGW